MLGRQIELFNYAKGSPYFPDITVVRNRVRAEHPEWGLERHLQAEHTYREFWYKCLTTPGTHQIENRDADEYWHAHILFMKKYEEDCRLFFGYLLMHNPESQGKCGGRCQRDGNDGGGIKQ